MNRKSMFLFSVVLAMSSATLFADGDPVVPTVKFAGCINGNLCVTLEKTVNPTNVLFQVKSLDFPSSDWRTVDFNYKSSRGTLSDCYSYYRTVDVPGVTLVRIAETNAVGTSAWCVTGPVTNFFYHATTESCPPDSAGNPNSGANGYQQTINDGIVNTIREANNGKYQSDTNVWLGVKSNSGALVGASMIRYVPRQDSLGLARIKDAYFQCADDASFLTNVVTIGTVASSLSLGRVYECVVEPPVTSRYFRVLRYVGTDPGNYLSIDDMELVPDALPEKMSISVADSGDWTNHWPAVTWSVPAADFCNTGVLQRAVSAAGPFADVSEWTDATTGETFVDTNTAVGVTYYYRVKAQCLAAPFRGFHYSDVVKYVRPRRLERSWDNLATLNIGMSVMKPFLWLGSSWGQDKMPKCFDGNITTFPDSIAIYVGDVRYKNPVIGVNLGAKYHICGSLVYPRESTAASILDRARVLSIFGADDEDLAGVRELSPKLGGFPVSMWQYNATTNSVDQFQYVFLWVPAPAENFGNLSEVGFFGYSDQDIVDSGLLIPPTTVSCETNEVGVVVSWDRGWNNASYRVERSRAGFDEWTPVASLATNVFSFVDKRVRRKGTWSWRVTAVAEGGDTISSLPCSCYCDPKVGMAIIFR